MMQDEEISHGNGVGTCFHENLNLLVRKLRASHDAEVEVLRNQILRLNCKYPILTPRDDQQLCSQVLSKASLGNLPLPKAPVEPVIVASGGGWILSAEAEEVMPMQSTTKEQKLEQGPTEAPQPACCQDGHDSNEKCNFSTRGVWKLSDAEENAHIRSMSQIDSVVEETDGGTPKRDFSQQRVPVLERPAKLENMNWFVSSPTTPWRVGWNVMGLFAVVYDMIMIPLLLMELPDLQTLDNIGFGLHAYWNLDIVANFAVAYYDHEGDLVTQPAQIAKHYASSWLPLDAGLVGLDWGLYAMDLLGRGGGQDELQAGRTLRIIRFLRILRLMRLLKLGALMAPILDNFSYGVTVMYFLVLKIILGVLVMNHFMACFWFAVGASGDDGWVTNEKVREHGFMRGYVQAYHWCLTQFGVGSSPVYPNNDGEFCFAILCLVVALIVFSSMVSLTTDAMLRLQKMTHERSEKFSHYRKYCKDRRVSKDLFGRTLRYLEYAYDQREKKTPAADVKLIEYLSGPLRNELQLQIWVPDISAHAFFRLLCKQELSTMQVVCRDGMVEMHFAQEDHVFHTGQLAKHMYFIIEGILNYSSNRSGVDEQIGKRRCISEAAMWTDWLHLGFLSVEIECRLLGLDVDIFSDCVKGHPGAFLRVKQYAEWFVTCLNDSTYDDLTDLETDLFDKALSLECQVSDLTSDNA